MHAEPVNPREGKATIVVGVAAILSGIAVQAFNVQSVASQAPPQFGSTSSSATLLATIAGLVILGGVLLTIVGVIRFAQSGRPSVAGYTQAWADPAVAAPSASGSHAKTFSNPPAANVYCASCGARIVGEGRYCASCGASTAR